MSYDFGQPIVEQFLTYSDANRTTLADATAVTFDLLNPDATVTTLTLGAGVTHDSTGTYHVTLSPTVAGHYSFQWTATGTVATAASGQFDVRAKFDVSIVSLEDVKAHLNLTSTTNDDELRGYIDAATNVITSRIGPVGQTTYTEVHNGGKATLVLDHAPVLSITSLTEYVGLTGYVDTLQPLGSTTSNYGYSIDDPDVGIVSRRSSAGTLIPFMGGPRSVTVTYVGGRAIIPAAVRLATLKLIKHMWTDQRGSGAGRVVPGGVGDEYLPPQTAHLVPWEVEELLRPYMPAAVIA